MLVWYRDQQYATQDTNKPLFDPPSIGTKGSVLLVGLAPGPLRRSGVAADADPTLLDNLSNRVQTSNAAFGFRRTDRFRECIEVTTGSGRLTCNTHHARRAVRTFTDRLGWYPGFEHRPDLDAENPLFFRDEDASVVVPSRGNQIYSTRITDGEGRPLPELFGADIGGGHVLGTGHPKDGNPLTGAATSRWASSSSRSARARTTAGSTSGCTRRRRLTLGAQHGGSRARRHQPAGRAPFLGVGGSGASQALDLAGSERPPRAGRQRPQFERPVARPLQRPDTQAERRQHPPDLPIPPLVDRDVDDAARRSRHDDLHARRATVRPSSSCIPRSRRRTWSALITVESVARYVFSTPCLGCASRCASSPSLVRSSRPVVMASSLPTGKTRSSTSTRSRTVFRPSGSDKGRDDTERLVQQQVDEALGPDRTTVERDGRVGRDRAAVLPHDRAVDRHAPCLDQLVRPAPRRDAGLSQVAVEADGVGHGGWPGDGRSGAS
jgi:hypothetical protein